jgi:hypothetical protein
MASKSSKSKARTQPLPPPPPPTPPQPQHDEDTALSLWVRIAGTSAALMYSRLADAPDLYSALAPLEVELLGPGYRMEKSEDCVRILYGDLLVDQLCSMER